ARRDRLAVQEGSGSGETTLVNSVERRRWLLFQICLRAVQRLAGALQIAGARLGADDSVAGVQVARPFVARHARRPDVAPQAAVLAVIGEEPHDSRALLIADQPVVEIADEPDVDRPRDA